MGALPDDERIKVAVVTGKHGFDVPAFHGLFRDLHGVDAYIQPMEDWCEDVARVREHYDVTLFYNMHAQTPTGSETGPLKHMKAAIEALGTTAQGIFVLHHAILAFPEWPLWSEMVGIPDRSLSAYRHDQDLSVAIPDRHHPIVRGIDPFGITDETYAMRDPGEDSSPLLTVDHPESMRTIAWARHYRSSCVFCLQLGHDPQAWSNPAFQLILLRGIQWCAQCL